MALGDGNLSNPNGRAVRLRVTCDKKYPKLLNHIKESIQDLLPNNRVSLVNKTGCMDISVYSNQLTQLIGYEWNDGPKNVQNVGVHQWIKDNARYSKECLRGLIQTDGSLYIDRGYPMVNFTNTGKQLADDVFSIIENLGYEPNMQIVHPKIGKTRYNIRIVKNVRKFIEEINLWKE